MENLKRAPRRENIGRIGRSCSRSSVPFRPASRFDPTQAQLQSLPDSVSRWQPWPDTVDALKRLSGRYRLAIISNIDDELFARTREFLPVKFVDVTTAQQARCYKPGLEIFRLALTKTAVPHSRILHVGQSFITMCCPRNLLNWRPLGKSPLASRRNWGGHTSGRDAGPGSSRSRNPRDTGRLLNSF